MRCGAQPLGSGTMPARNIKRIDDVDTRAPAGFSFSTISPPMMTTQCWNCGTTWRLGTSARRACGFRTTRRRRCTRSHWHELRHAVQVQTRSLGAPWARSRPSQPGDPHGPDESDPVRESRSCVPRSSSRHAAVRRGIIWGKAPMRRDGVPRGIGWDRARVLPLLGFRYRSIWPRAASGLESRRAAVFAPMCHRMHMAGARASDRHRGHSSSIHVADSTVRAGFLQSRDRLGGYWAYLSDEPRSEPGCAPANYVAYH